jgi:hypothetical protein
MSWTGLTNQACNSTYEDLCGRNMINRTVTCWISANAPKITCKKLELIAAPVVELLHFELCTPSRMQMQAHPAVPVAGKWTQQCTKKDVPLPRKANRAAVHAWRSGK